MLRCGHISKWNQRSHVVVVVSHVTTTKRNMCQTFYNLASNEMGMSMEWNKTQIESIHTAYKMKLSNKNFFGQCDAVSWMTKLCVTFTEEIPNGKHDFLSIVLHRFPIFIGIIIRSTLFFLIQFEILLKMSWSLSKTFFKAKKCDIILGIILVIVFVALFSNSRQQIHGRKHCFQILTNKYTLPINILKNT